MVNEVKTLEQIQEEFKKKISEFTNNDNNEAVLEKVPINEIVEDLEEEENLINEEREQSMDAPQLFMGEKEIFSEEERIFPEIIKPYKTKKSVVWVRVLTSIIITLCVVGIVLGGIMFIVGKNPEKEFFGYGFYPENTELMSPKYNRGDMVLYEAKDVEEIVDETTIGSYIVAYTNNERKVLCVAQVEMIYRDNRTGDVYYQIRADKDIPEYNNTIQVHLVKGKAKFYPLKWFAFGTHYVITYVKYFAIGLFAALVASVLVRAIFGRKIKLQHEDDFDDEE